MRKRLLPVYGQTEPSLKRVQNSVHQEHRPASPPVNTCSR